MKKTYIILALTAAIMSTFGFVVKNQKPIEEKQTNFATVKHGAEKTGFTETISL
jgi:hypothetical protein